MRGTMKSWASGRVSELAPKNSSMGSRNSQKTTPKRALATISRSTECPSMALAFCMSPRPSSMEQRAAQPMATSWQKAMSRLIAGKVTAMAPRAVGPMPYPM